MTTTIQSPARDLQKKGAFTLLEVIVATTLFGLIMTGVVATTVQVMRSGFNNAQYAEMEQESRKGLELFARDVRMAKIVNWKSPTEVALDVVTDGIGTLQTVTFKYDSDKAIFTRTVGTSTQTLFSGISTEAGAFEMKGYMITGTEITPADIQTKPGQASANTKEIQLNLTCKRSRPTLNTTTNKVISARFILRNKVVASK